MDRVNSHRHGWRCLPRRLVAGFLAGLPVLGVACSGVTLVSDYPEMPAPAHVRQASPPPPEIQAVQYAAPVEPKVALPREVPITLDTVFRLAEQQNPKIALAREKLNESLLAQAQKARVWLPNVYAGVAYFRHEGGIQDFNGNLVHSSFGALSPGLNVQGELDLREATFQMIESQRRVLQEQVSRCQINNEVLLDAALTYVDLLTARRGELIARDIEVYEQKLLDLAEKIAKIEKGAAGFVEGVRATLSGRGQLLSQLRQKGKASSAKLVYLLGLPPQTVLIPIDPVLAPIELVDVSGGADRLVAQALAQGPCIHELQGILGIIQLGMDKSNSVHNLLPSLQVNAYEGGFGAGPGGNLAWANRLDVTVALRWNLTQLCQSDFLRTTARSKQAQALLSYDDLRGKLAAGVLEATESIYAGREQIGFATSQVRQAGENYRFIDRRLDAGLQTASPTEVLLSIRSLEQAHFNYLSTIAAHNKAQIRLLLLLGASCPGGPPPVAPVAPVSVPLLPVPVPSVRLLPAPGELR
jgi:outer membrane protein TolC